MGEVQGLRFGLVMEDVQKRLESEENKRQQEAEDFERQLTLTVEPMTKRRAGRPRKQENRTHQICYFATDAEVEDIDRGMRLKGCSSRAQYIRFAVFCYMTFHQKMSLTKFL